MTSMRCPNCRSPRLTYSEWIPMQQMCDLVDGVAGRWTATWAQGCPTNRAIICQACTHEWTPDAGTLEHIDDTLLDFTGSSGGNQPPAPARVSPAMARVLLNLYQRLGALGPSPWPHYARCQRPDRARVGRSWPGCRRI